MMPSGSKRYSRRSATGTGRRPEVVEDVAYGEEVVQALARAHAQKGFVEGAVVVVGLDQGRHQLEAAGPDQSVEGGHPGGDITPLVAGDRRLRGTGPPSQLGLGQPGPVAGLADEQPSVHESQYTSIGISLYGKR